MRLVVALLLLLPLSGCFPQVVAPERANERWLRIETEHFDLSTDLTPDDAKNAAESLERTRAALLAAAWNRGVDGRITSRTSVVVLREKLDFDHYAQNRYSGFYAAVVRPTLFMWGAPERWEQRPSLTDESTTSVLRHELVHRLAAGIYGRQPRWFSEGLAQFLETMHVSEDGTKASLGAANLTALRNYHVTRGASVADALAWKVNAGVDDRTMSSLYGVSWLLVHFLYNTQPAAFAAFQTRLATGTDPAVAWTASFPTLEPAELDKQINHYSKYGTFAEFERPLVRVEVQQTSRPITAADVLAIRAQLATTSSIIRGSEELKTEARQEIDRALALEPGNALALRLLRLHMHAVPGDAVARLRQQVVKRPDDGEAWLLLGEALHDDRRAEREAALRRAIVLMPRSAEAYNALAWELVLTDRAGAALPLATKAAVLAPWSAAVLDTYAACLFAVGRCPDALTQERRAVELIPESASGAEALPYTLKLAEYVKTCGEAPQPQ